MRSYYRSFVLRTAAIIIEYIVLRIVLPYYLSYSSTFSIHTIVRSYLYHALVVLAVVLAHVGSLDDSSGAGVR